jgi:hypothetical protein
MIFLGPRCLDHVLWRDYSCLMGWPATDLQWIHNFLLLSWQISWVYSYEQVLHCRRAHPYLGWKDCSFSFWLGHVLMLNGHFFCLFAETTLSSHQSRTQMALLVSACTRALSSTAGEQTASRRPYTSTPSLFCVSSYAVSDCTLSWSTWSSAARRIWIAWMSSFYYRYHNYTIFVYYQFA